MEWIFARWLTNVATVLIVGACAVGLALLPRLVADGATRAAIAADAARTGIIACCAMIPASFMRLADQILALRSPGDPLLIGAGPLLRSTMWGAGFLWQCLALVVAFVGLWACRRTSHRAWPWLVATVGAAGLCATPALQGHAIGNEMYTTIALTADIAHVIGAGVWIGGISVIGWLGVAIPNADGIVVPTQAALADARLRQLVPLVPPIALSGAALLTTSGVAASVLPLRGVGDLWSTGWGRYVMLKAVLLLIIVTLGALNWRRLGPRLRDATGVTALRRSLLIELALAAVVLVVTAILVVTPLPGE